MGNLHRSYNQQLGGVCAGIAEYFGWDASTVRIITLILILFGGISIWVYLILWIVMPGPDNYGGFNGNGSNGSSSSYNRSRGRRRNRY